MKRLQVTIVIIFSLILNISISAQLTQITGPNMMSEANVYKDANGALFSTLVTFKFKSKMVNINRGQKTVNENGILHSNFKGLLSRIRAQYGNFVINKTVPDVQWEDSLKVNKRTNQIVHVVDLSQIYRLIFNSPVPVNQVVNMLKTSRNVVYAEGPIIAYETLSANDPWYQDSNYRWSFDAINAEGAWDITKGSPLIGIGMDDSFGGVNQLHEDLVGKVVWDNLGGNYGGHGIITSGVAGAMTDNNTDIASLGWKLNLLLTQWGIANIDSLVKNGADVINFSWVTGYSSALSDAIQSALQQGRVCVASAGNDEWTIPGLRYPAAFNFGSTGQVIAVSGTEIIDNAEKFISTFNYSPGTDPINDPTNAFIDCAAPGANYRGLSDVSATGTVHIWYGTSISSPFVSAMVGLMLSVDSTLTPNQVYDIIKNTSDKIGTHPYDANGWNQYLGYGRINAANAVNVATGAPAMPRNLKVVSNGTNPVISWDANTESDLNGYILYRSADGGSFYSIAYLDKNSNSYIDDEAIFSKPIWEVKLVYKVKAKDTQSKYSLFSNPDSINGQPLLLPKAFKDEEQTEITSYSIKQNYPNPFNPSTQINYQIPKDGFVSLVVYNTLGQVVSELVNEYQTSGKYTVQFNAISGNRQIPSGIYFYKIESGNFTKVNKMLLLK